MTALEVFNQNDGEVTKSFYAELNTYGFAGQLGVALFRAQKRQGLPPWQVAACGL